MTSRLASAYTVLRGSKIFLVGLVVFVSAWALLHFVAGFDPDFGDLNTILSSEASLSLAFFTMVANEQAQMQSVQQSQLRELVADTRRIAAATLSIAESLREKG